MPQKAERGNTNTWNDRGQGRNHEVAVACCYAGNQNDFAERFIVKPGKHLKHSVRDPNDTAGVRGKAHCEVALQRNIEQLRNLQTLLAASGKYAVLVVLQAMDTGGKDGTIRHVMTGLDPSACRETAFKVPTAEELRHDFLWRVHKGPSP